MLALRKTAAAFGLEFQDIPDPPPPGPAEVVLRVDAVGICGSDVHAYEWTAGYEFMVPNLPLTMGHEFAGTVVRNGTGSGFAEGDRVAVIPFVFCGYSPELPGRRHAQLPGRQGIGLTRDGGFQAEVRVPSRCCVALPEELDTELAALTEPLGVGAEAVLTGEVGLGDTVLVLGPGTIGQAIALIARLAGAARVIVAGRADAPRFDVLRALGLPDLVDVADAPAEGPGAGADRRPRRGRGAGGDRRAAALNEGMAVLKKGGVIVAAGIHAAPLTLPLTDFVRMRDQLRATHGAAAAPGTACWRNSSRDPEGFRPMITHRMPLERGIEGSSLPGSAPPAR